jgi:hypothetical protein
MVVSLTLTRVLKTVTQPYIRSAFKSGWWYSDLLWLALASGISDGDWARLVEVIVDQSRNLLGSPKQVRMNCSGAQRARWPQCDFLAS